MFENHSVIGGLGGAVCEILSDNFPVPVVLIEDLIGLKIQAYKNDSKREFQDKADIQSLLDKYPNLNFDKIKEYADLFSEWNFINELRNKL